MVVSHNGSAVQQSTSAAVGLQANESFTFKHSNDIILITERTGREARRVLREQNRKMKEICEGVTGYTNELDKIIDNDEEHENQQDTGKKLP